VTVSEMILSVLRGRLQNQATIDNLVGNTTEILIALCAHPQTSKAMLEWASTSMKAQYAQSIWELTRKEHRWHFSALRASARQLEDFQSEDLAEKMERLAPDIIFRS
jgi:hypothetical protein